MRVLIISDGHGALDQLNRIEPLTRDADMVLYGGDFSLVGAPDSGKTFLERFASFHDRIFAVIGNHDEPDFLDAIEEYDMSVEGSLSYFNGLVLSGSGGGGKFDGTTPNERADEELADDLRLVAESAASEGGDGEGLWDNLVIIAHHPPKDTKLDVIGNGMHVGSPSIRAFIEKHKPLLVVSGHIHESAAIDKLGGTTLVNPGSLADGKYAIAEISGGGKVPFVIASIELKSLD